MKTFVSLKSFLLSRRTKRQKMKATTRYMTYIPCKQRLIQDGPITPLSLSYLHCEIRRIQPLLSYS